MQHAANDAKDIDRGSTDKEKYNVIFGLALFKILNLILSDSAREPIITFGGGGDEVRLNGVKLYGDAT